MYGDLDLFSTAAALARHAAARHAVVAENLANADTPGYAARDVEPFSATLDQMSWDGTPGDAVAPKVVQTDLPAGPDGNSVVVEQQMLNAADTEAQHQLALAVYAKGITLLRTALDRAG